MTIHEDSVLLEPGNRVYLYEVNASVIDVAAGMLHFHGYKTDKIITWRGVQYHPYPIEVQGFSRTGDKPPTPSLTVANLDGAITAMCLMYDDLVGAILTVRSTMVKYLDGVNFEGGVNPTEDLSEQYPDEIWYLDRKEHEDYRSVKWSLSSALDFNGILLPRRVIVANQCAWRYRSPECSYAGPPVAKYDDTPTSDPALDDCSRTVNGCKLRFGEFGELPYGSFPSSGMVR